MNCFGCLASCLLSYRGQERGPVRAEPARPLALEMFGEDVDVDTGVGYRREVRSAAA